MHKNFLIALIVTIGLVGCGGGGGNGDDGGGNGSDSWVKSSFNPVLNRGSSGSWDSGLIGSPTVIKDGTVFKMWYSGATSNSTTYNIGYATSSDGINWTKYANNPVFSVSNGVNDPSVIKDGSTYKMWFTSYNSSIGYAESNDGINWSLVNAAVLNKGSYPAWDSGFVSQPSVLKVGAIFHMYYYGGMTTFYSLDTWKEPGIGHATSQDGIAWTKDQNNPCIPQDYDIDGELSNPEGPCALYDGTNFVVYYTCWYDVKKKVSSNSSNFGDSEFVMYSGNDNIWDDYIFSPSVLADSPDFMWYGGFPGNPPVYGTVFSRDIGVATK